MALFVNQYVGDIINTGKVTCKAFVEKNILCLENYLSQYAVLVYTQQARKPRSYASPKLRPTDLPTYLLTGVKCRATSVAKKLRTLFLPFRCLDLIDLIP